MGQYTSTNLEINAKQLKKNDMYFKIINGIAIRITKKNCMT